MSRDVCPHPDFEVFARVARIEGTPAGIGEGVTKFMTDVHVRCARCKTRFRWLGMEQRMGLQWSQPMVSVDQLELRAPIEPDGHMTSLMAGADTGWPGPVAQDPADALERAMHELEEIARILGAVDAGTLNIPALAARRMAELAELQQLIVAANGAHPVEHVWSTTCPACIAQRRLRELAKRWTQEHQAATEGDHCVVIDRGYVDRELRNCVGVTCKCGAFWTHPNGTSDSEIQSTYESHLKYFTRPKTVTL